MKLIDRFLNRSPAPEVRASESDVGTLQNPSKDLIAALLADDGMVGTASGVSVSERRAEGLSALYCGVRIISETGSSGPINIHSRDEARRGEVIRDHPAYRLLREPNPHQTAMSLRESLYWCANVWGRGLAEIERRSNGEAMALHFIHSSKVTVDERALEKNQLVWLVSRGMGKPDAIPDKDMFHLKGPGEGLFGKPIVTLMRETFGRALAVREHGAVYFNNGGRIQALLEHPNDLTEEKLRQLHRGIQKMLAGGKDGKQKVGIMTAGLKLASGGVLAINNEDAQFLETEYFGIEEVCRILNIQPHLVKHLLRATNNNIEHQGIEFYTVTMLPWFKRFEEEAERKLLSPADREDFYIRHNADFILRGDSKSRMDSHGVAIQWGIKTRDEVRALEDLAPYPDGLGSIPLVPTTHQPTKNLLMQKPDESPKPDTGNGEPSDPEPKEDENRSSDPLRVKDLLSDIIQASFERMGRVESDKMARASKKADTYPAWIDKFVVEHRARVHDELSAPVAALIELSGNTPKPSILDGIVDDYLGRLVTGLRSVDPSSFVNRDISWVISKAGA